MKIFAYAITAVSVATLASGCGRPASQAARALSRDAAEAAAKRYGAEARRVPPPRTRQADPNVRPRPGVAARAEAFAAARAEDAAKQALEDAIKDQFED